MVGTRTRDTAPAAWGGQVTIRAGLLTLTGSIGDAELHAHACHQLLIVTTGTVTLHGGSRDRRDVNDVAMIPAGVPHRVKASPDAHGLAAYLDADSIAGRAATARIRSTDGDPERPATWAAIPNTAQPTPPTPTPTTRLPHPVLTEAIRLATTTCSGPPDLTVLARQVSISPSRLGHLYAEHLGLSYPVWRRWVRLQHAMTAVRHGASLTAAAHRAGYADSAHLSRTTRAMFGLTPTQARAAVDWA